jgi:hypothetical protein
MQAETLIATYFQGKDENRPHLMARAFAPNAVLEMVVNTGAISFPAVATGVEAIADTLSRKFGQTYENVYTFSLQRPPAEAGLKQFSCDWMVGMTAKEGGQARVGCGRYDWQFQSEEPFLVARLKITIDEMQVLPAECASEIVEWVANLPRFWCTPQQVIDAAPRIDALEPVLAYIRK